MLSFCNASQIGWDGYACRLTQRKRTKPKQKQTKNSLIAGEDKKNDRTNKNRWVFLLVFFFFFFFAFFFFSSCLFLVLVLPLVVVFLLHFVFLHHHYHHHLLLFFFSSYSPWYNRTGWLGVKHELTYLLTSSPILVIPYWFYIDRNT